MHWKQSLWLSAPLAWSVYSNTILRFSCSQLNVQRLDPLVFPGVNPSPHLHQIVGGNSFNTTMNPATDIGNASTCTTCTFTQDFSNYWTATLFFRARNGTFHRVQQIGNEGFEAANGGMTVYYVQPYDNSKVTGFKEGFRMTVGNPMIRNATGAAKFRQLTFTCLQNAGDRSDESINMPIKPCPSGIMANIRFPTCWDGENLDSADHQSHVAYPASGTFESNGPCPSTHPVKIPQVFYEVVWDTTPFNDPSIWPTDGSQPFIWSFGDPTGFGTHGDYVFGWKGTALQDALNANCEVTCPVLTSQDISSANKCTKPAVVNENIDGWLTALPGGIPVSGTNPTTIISTSSLPQSTSGSSGSGTTPAGTAAHYGQCGGQGWTGPTTCQSPYTCKRSNDYYSQCL